MKNERRKFTTNLYDSNKDINITLFPNDVILIHEHMDKHIGIISREVEKAFGLHNKVLNFDLGNYFVPIKKWKGFFHSDEQLESLVKKYGGLKSAIITPRDIYFNDESKDDDWIFGYSVELFSVTATARMKRYDNKPSKKIIVPEEKYLKRVISTVIHEIGHDVVKSDHLMPAKWVSLKNNYAFELGPHCTDNKCVLYEIVDINAPPKEEGYMLLGEEKKYDTGIDECIDRGYKDWFCKKCRDSIVLDERYF